MRTSSSINLHVAIFGCCFCLFFRRPRAESLFFFRFSGGSARASKRRHDKRGRLKPSVTRVLLGSPRKKRDWLSSNFCALLFPEVCYFCLFCFFLTGHCRHHHAELLYWNLHSQFLRSDNFSRWFFSRACFKSENRTFIHLYQRYKFLTPFRMFLLCDAPLKELHACLTRDGANATFDGTNLIFAGKGIQL